jgi:hypothetical protein
MLKDFLADYGIHLNNAIAGFCGGVVNAVVFKRSDRLSIAGSIVVGTLTAAYLGEPVAQHIPVQGSAAGFIVGLGGMAICQGLLDGIKKWRRSILPPHS